ncbi:uncharacterized protein LOC110466637 [Mizuhopecten yessoensis]|uniref:Uncharacterized protein n=1 Tax=Mizuhopecten yessoensis TaxID=6573 RepID=A0A210PNP7_MIZYE|nr:uncharacterized protein LOC110466637 [Mizuhopecten yessoensis]OWF38130.1 hypothetical protein KP79_PYT08842 [Mizuhopecten yessoensis]
MSSKLHLKTKMVEQNICRSVSMDSLLIEGDSELMSQFVHFYTERIATRERLRNIMRINLSRPENIKKTFLDTAMDTLRKEMAAMMDYDLSLTKQLLILQDSIEDILAGEDYCDLCNSSDPCTEIHMCSPCTCRSQKVSEKLKNTSSVSDHTKYCSMEDLRDGDMHSSVKSLKQRNRGGHQKQNSNDSGYCCIFQDLEVTI